MSDTADHLEREVEARRASVESTLDALKDRMSVNQVIDDVGNFVGVDDIRGMLGNAGRQVRDNPIALGMIGVGLAWLVMSNSSSQGSSRSRTSTRNLPDYRRDPYGRDQSYEPYGGSQGEWRSERGVMSKVKDAVSGAAESVSHAASAAGEKISSRLHDARDRGEHVRDDMYGRAGVARESMAGHADDMRHRAGHLRDRVSDRAGHMRDSMASRMEQQPLLIGAAAVVVGAIIGAALPRTRTEDRWMGSTRDHLMDEARTASGEMRDRAMHAAEETYHAAVDQARDEGLVPKSGETLASKVERVAEAAVHEAKDQIDPVLHGAEEKAKSSSTSSSSSPASGSTGTSASAGTSAGAGGAAAGSSGSIGSTPSTPRKV